MTPLEVQLSCKQLMKESPILVYWSDRIHSHIQCIEQGEIEYFENGKYTVIIAMCSEWWSCWVIKVGGEMRAKNIHEFNKILLIQFYMSGNLQRIWEYSDKQRQNRPDS